jgi:hypothetical protein
MPAPITVLIKIEDDPLEAEPCQRQVDVVGRLSVPVGMADENGIILKRLGFGLALT